MSRNGKEATIEDVLGRDEIIAVKFWDKLHDLAGRCGHCGKRACPQRASWSTMPDTLKLDHVIAAATAAGIDI